MSGIISYTHFGGRSGIIGGVPSFYCTLAPGAAAAEGTYTFPEADEIVYDTGNNITNGSHGTSQWSNGIYFTAPISGYDQFNCLFNLSTVPQMSGYLRASLLTDNAESTYGGSNLEFWANQGTDAWSGAADYHTLPISQTVRLFKGDRATVAIINNGGSVTMVSYRDHGDGFSGHLIQPV